MWRLCQSNNDIAIMEIAVLIHVMLSSCLVAARSWQWKLNNNGTDIIYTGDTKFIVQATHPWECAKLCAKYGESCLAFSVVPSTVACYGYGETINPGVAPGARLWTRTCKLQGYKEVSSLKKCIRYSTDKLNWYQSSFACKSEGGSLLRLDKNETTTDLQSSDPYWWIGGRDIGVDNDRDWKWENGITVDDSQWRPGYPSTGNCIEIYRSKEGLFTYNCAYEQAYICQE